MSADLEFFQDFPQIRMLKSVTDHVTRRPDESAENNDDSGCRTPTAAEYKIPAVLTCPPAPQKPKGPVISCKRKLTEFFEIVHRDDVDEFFRSAIETTAVTKRRCRDLKFESEI